MHIDLASGYNDKMNIAGNIKKNRDEKKFKEIYHICSFKYLQKYNGKRKMHQFKSYDVSLE